LPPTVPPLCGVCHRRTYLEWFVELRFICPWQGKDLATTRGSFTNHCNREEILRKIVYILLTFLGVSS
jgi:hypothetical protein